MISMGVIASQITTSPKQWVYIGIWSHDEWHVMDSSESSPEYIIVELEANYPANNFSIGQLMSVYSTDAQEYFMFQVQ